MTDSPQALPITQATIGDLAPHAWVIQLEATICTTCNTRKTHCRVFAKTHLRSRTGAGKYVTNLRPVTGPKDIKWNIPIEPITAPDRVVPFCEECFDQVSLSHLPPPPPPPSTHVAMTNIMADARTAADLERLENTLKSGSGKAISRAAKSATPASRKPKTPPTVDDLLI